MSGLDNLKARINYYGGSEQQERMIRDKLISLKGALKNSYQAATVQLAVNRKFKCLLNPDKLNEDYDYKIISIPFNDINLCTNIEENIGLKIGDIFLWERNNSEWIVVLQHLEELAYFRGECYRINSLANLNGREQKCYVKGPDNLSIAWNSKYNSIWNDLNYDAVMIVPKTNENIEFFKRFNKLKIEDKVWEIQGKNLFENGIIEVAIKESFNNTMEDAMRDNTPIEPEHPDEEIYIKGENLVIPYEKFEYQIQNADAVDSWSLSNSKYATILASNETKVRIGILASKSVSFILSCTIGSETYSKEITVKSI